MSLSPREQQIAREQERLDLLERMATVPDDQLDKMIQSYWRTYREERDRLEPFYYERIRRTARKHAPDAALLVLEASTDGDDSWHFGFLKDASGAIIESDALMGDEEFFTLLSDLAHWHSSIGEDKYEIPL